MPVSSQVCLPAYPYQPSFKMHGLRILSSAATEAPHALQTPLNKLLKYGADFSC